MSCGDRRFTEADVRLAEALAGRVAAVVDKARLYDREHLVAVSLQRAMQTALPALEGVQAAARYLSAPAGSEVGGDWYDGFRLPDGGIGLVIGDVVGHDLAAAIRMGQLRNLLRAVAFDRQEGPGSVVGRLDRLNDRLAVTDLVTLLYGELRAAADGRMALRFVNAGHVPPVLIDPDGGARLLDDHVDVPIGAPADGARQPSTITLVPGATLVLYTDGLVETRAGGLAPGLAKLLEACTGHADQPVDRLVDRLLAALGPPREDDVAVLAVRLDDGDARRP